MNAYLANPALLLFPLSSSCSTHYIIKPGSPFRRTGILAYREQLGEQKVTTVLTFPTFLARYSAVIIVALIGNFRHSEAALSEAIL